MADPKPIYLYSEFEKNDELKSAAGKAGAAITFDRDKRAYQLKTDGVSAGDLKAQKAALKGYTGKAAEKRWSADRDARDEQMAAARTAAKSRESTTKEPKPEKAPVENKILVYPALSQKDEFVALVMETSSTYKYRRASENQEAHFAVSTDMPDRFKAYQGAEAEDRFKREFAERGSATSASKETVSGAVEKARDAARSRGSAAFMAQYIDRGFRLGDPKLDAANHSQQLDSMRNASTKQLILVAQKSRELLNPLREKEMEMRAEAAGLPIEQVRAMSFADQKKVAVGNDGKSVGLTGEDYRLNLQLSRGLAAINVELREGRKVGLTRASESERSNEGERSKTQERSNERSQTRAPAKTVNQDQAVDQDAALMAAFSRGRAGAGR